MKKPKALILFSGGLDSILAAKILMEQGIKITALFFKSHFFDSKQALPNTFFPVDKDNIPGVANACAFIVSEPVI